jgi:hypothetical protein
VRAGDGRRLARKEHVWPRRIVLYGGTRVRTCVDNRPSPTSICPWRRGYRARVANETVAADPNVLSIRAKGWMNDRSATSAKGCQDAAREEHPETAPQGLAHTWLRTRRNVSCGVSAIPLPISRSTTSGVAQRRVPTTHATAGSLSRSATAPRGPFPPPPQAIARTPRGGRPSGRSEHASSRLSSST